MLTLPFGAAARRARDEPAPAEAPEALDAREDEPERRREEDEYRRATGEPAVK